MADRRVAEELARALAGEATDVAEAGQLAALLRRAAAPLMFEVTAAETEAVLATVVRRTQQRRRLPGWVAAVAVGIAVGLLLVLALPGVHAPGVDVEARALAAVRHAGPVVELATRTVRPGHRTELLRTEWVATDGRARVSTTLDGSVVRDIVREPGGRVVEYATAAHRVVVAPSCRAIAGACSELVDPIALYRNRLSAGHITDLRAVRFDGQRAYRFVLAAQALGPGTTRITQVVVVDAATYLPRRIVWEQTTHGRTTTVAVIDVLQVVSLAAASPQVFQVSAPAGVPVVQLRASGAGPLGPPSVSTLALSRARALFPHAYWVGRRYHGLRLTGVHQLAWPTGRALRLDYGPLTLWNFDRVVPPALLEGRLLPAKALPLGEAVARFYVDSKGELVAERDVTGGSVAAVAPQLLKEQVFEVLSNARPLD